MSASAPHPKPEPNTTSASIRADEVLLAEEFRRRFRLQKHSWRQIRRMGLRVARFGSKDFVLGRDVLEFFAKLATEQQSGEGNHGQ